MRALLLLLASAAAAAANDANALVQAQIRAHSHGAAALGRAAAAEEMQAAAQGAADSFAQQLAEAVARVSQKGALAMDGKELATAESHLFVRRSIRNPDGSRVEFSVKSDTGSCETSDEFGSNDCTLHWGQMITVKSVIHLAKGLQKGDRVVISLASRIQALNTSESVAMTMTGAGFGAGADCSICQGSCTVSLHEQDGKFTMDATHPSVIANKTFCASLETQPLTEITIADFTLPLALAPPDAWQVAADLLLTIELRGSNGEVKVAQTIEPKVTPGNVAPARLLAAEPRPRVSLAKVVRSSLREAVPNMFNEALKAKPAGAASLKEQGRKLANFVARIRLAGLENGGARNFSLSASRGCSAMGQGAMSCKFPFGDSADATLGVHLAYTTDEGSYAVVKVTPKVGGMLGLMAGALLKPETVRVPLCGEGMLKEQKVDAGPCGFHALNIAAPAFSLAFPDLAGISLGLGNPLLPPSLEDFPPMSSEVEIKMHHASGRSIGDFTLELGLGY